MFLDKEIKQQRDATKPEGVTDLWLPELTIVNEWLPFRPFSFEKWLIITPEVFNDWQLTTNEKMIVSIVDQYPGNCVEKVEIYSWMSRATVKRIIDKWLIIYHAKWLYPNNENILKLIEEWKRLKTKRNSKRDS